MRQQALSLAILLSLISLLRAVYPHISGGQVPDSTWAVISSASDPESLLARGEKLRLRCADLAALELIPGVADDLGSAILSHRHKAIAASFSVGDAEALTLIPGIGVKRARELARYLDLRTKSCTL
jgi:hypothetical protein